MRSHQDHLGCWESSSRCCRPFEHAIHKIIHEWSCLTIPTTCWSKSCLNGLRQCFVPPKTHHTSCVSAMFSNVWRNDYTLHYQLTHRKMKITKGKESPLECFNWFFSFVLVQAAQREMRKFMEISQRQQTRQKKTTVNWTICNAHVNCNYSSFIAGEKKTTPSATLYRVCEAAATKKFYFMGHHISTLLLLAFNLIYELINT